MCYRSLKTGAAILSAVGQYKHQVSSSEYYILSPQLMSKCCRAEYQYLKVTGAYFSPVTQLGHELITRFTGLPNQTLLYFTVLQEKYKSHKWSLIWAFCFPWFPSTFLTVPHPTEYTHANPSSSVSFLWQSIFSELKLFNEFIEFLSWRYSVSINLQFFF